MSGSFQERAELGAGVRAQERRLGTKSPSVWAVCEL